MFIVFFVQPIHHLLHSPPRSPSSHEKKPSRMTATLRSVVDHDSEGVLRHRFLLVLDRHHRSDLFVFIFDRSCSPLSSIIACSSSITACLCSLAHLQSFIFIFNCSPRHRSQEPLSQPPCWCSSLIICLTVNLRKLRRDLCAPHRRSYASSLILCFI